MFGGFVEADASGTLARFNIEAPHPNHLITTRIHCFDLSAAFGFFHQFYFPRMHFHIRRLPV
jgi:hypothetical protein